LKQKVYRFLRAGRTFHVANQQIQNTENVLIDQIVIDC